jgi:hypothetical protein
MNANMNLVTGFWGENHVTARDMRALYAGLTGQESFVFDGIGDSFRLDMVTANTARLYSGEGIMQGAHFRIEGSDTVDLNIENGVTGYYRNDLVVARYTKSIETHVEAVNAVVIKGTMSTDAAVDPEYNTGDLIKNELTILDMPLWRIPLNGLSVGTPVQLFKRINWITKEATITIPPSAWSDHLATVNCPIVTAQSQQDILPMIANTAENRANNEAIAEAGLQDAGQSDGHLVFYAESVPTTAISLRVVVRRG